MSVTIRIPTPLRKVTNGADKAEVEGGSLSSIMSSLDAQFPGIQGRLCNDDGSLRSFVNIYMNLVGNPLCLQLRMGAILQSILV